MSDPYLLEDQPIVQDCKWCNGCVHGCTICLGILYREQRDVIKDLTEQLEGHKTRIGTLVDLNYNLTEQLTDSQGISKNYWQEILGLTRETVLDARKIDDLTKQLSDKDAELKSWRLNGLESEGVEQIEALTERLEESELSWMETAKADQRRIAMLEDENKDLTEKLSTLERIASLLEAREYHGSQGKKLYVRTQTEWGEITAEEAAALPQESNSES